MALLKSIEIEDTGAFVEYWRITHVQIDMSAMVEGPEQPIYGIIEVLLHGYSNQAARIAGKSPMKVHRVKFNSQDLGDPVVPQGMEFYEAIKPILYMVVKSLPEFEDSVDI